MSKIQVSKFNKQKYPFKDPVHCFSMQFVINKCFLLNPEKNNWRRSVLSNSRKTHTLIPKNDVYEPKARLFCNQLKSC